MKKLSIIALSTLALAVVSLNSCTKLAENLQYDLEMSTGSIDIIIPPYIDTMMEASGSQSTQYNIDSFIQNKTANVLHVSNITSAKFKSCEITINNATNALNFANFKSVKGSFFTESEPTPFLVNIPNNPDENASVLSLPVDTTHELRSYLTNSNHFTYTLGGKLRRPITDTLHCTMRCTFRMHVQG
jgi:hypothetical protein